MKDKQIKQRYNDALEALKSKNNSDNESIILSIEKIEDELYVYNKKIINDKINLGIGILGGLVFVFAGLGIMKTETFDFHFNLMKYVVSLMVSGFGTFSIPALFISYKKERFDNNIDTSKKLKKHETEILKLDEKAKVNVKKR